MAKKRTPYGATGFRGVGGVEGLLFAMIDRARMDAQKGEIEAIAWLVNESPELLALVIDAPPEGLRARMKRAVKGWQQGKRRTVQPSKQAA